LKNPLLQIFPEDLGNSALCFRNIFRGNLPDNITIHSKIVMDNLVSQADNGFPRNIRIPVPDFRRDGCCGFTDLSIFRSTASTSCSR
jgi:hypothetical protein